MFVWVLIFGKIVVNVPILTFNRKLQLMGTYIPQFILRERRREEGKGEEEGREGGRERRREREKGEREREKGEREREIDVDR